MNYKYKNGSKILNVWRWDDDFHTKVVVDGNYDVEIQEDKAGKFFVWDERKIYINDWIRTSMRELKEKIKNGDWVTSDDLCQAILTDGIDNVRFIVPLNVTCGFGFLLDGNKTEDTLCKVVESFNREVKNNYKIRVVPVEANEKIASSRDYYTDSMISLIKEGYIKIVA